MTDRKQIQPAPPPILHWCSPAPVFDLIIVKYLQQYAGSVPLNRLDTQLVSLDLLAEKETQCCADGATGFLVMPGLSESIVLERFPDDSQRSALKSRWTWCTR
jgi:hypothetical protein